MNGVAWWWLGVAVVLCGSANDAMAQDSAPKTGTTEQTVAHAPDVVLLKNGDLFRGTIAQRLQSHTMIVLVTGETKRFEASEVRYAGPAEQLPGPEDDAAAPPAEDESGVDDDDESQEQDPEEGETSEEPGPKRHALYFTANGRRATLLARTATGGHFSPLCQAPCKK
jgi:hypothetical protein